MNKIKTSSKICPDVTSESNYENNPFCTEPNTTFYDLNYDTNSDHFCVETMETCKLNLSDKTIFVRKIFSPGQ